MALLPDILLLGRCCSESGAEWRTAAVSGGLEKWLTSRWVGERQELFARTGTG